MHAYSQPITPPPTTIIDAGMRSSVSSVSLSTMTEPSTATPSGCCGCAPVAMRKTCAADLARRLAVARHLDRLRVDEARRALDLRDLVPLDVLVDQLPLGVDHRALAEHEVGDR